MLSKSFSMGIKSRLGGSTLVVLSGFAVILTASCAQVEEQKATTPCSIAVPERTLIEKSTVADVRTTLTAFVATASNISNIEWRGKIEQTYQKLNDADASCAMLLRTVACLSEQGRTAAEVTDFRDYLKSTRSCEPTDQGNLSIDSVVQQFVSDAFRFKNAPVAIDLFVRNSGDKPAQISTVKVWFDEHLRNARAPSGMIPLSEVYAVTMDSTGGMVQGAQSNLNSPVKAWYPYPTEPVLIIETPVAQSLGPRSTDRFRIQYNFLDSMLSKGPREQLRVVVFYNDGKSTESPPIKIVRQDPCFQMGAPGTPANLICRNAAEPKERKK